ncbi:peptidoglycan editing factor PgeF [Polynucleobacter sp. JS-JIR-II-b4]|uniref:peptidoglycan editing factor PgeF n=1 Tax=Polynucleobacter sp. JS-JIR-II-b4 TaxID=1758390 RepID=UPI001BFE1605|nr:peptidoglycan editing factor PgeF [Polynucleobacter sp. JS-JIR-II-b4]
MSLVEPQWPAPKSVRTLVSTRSGGVSQAPYDSLNLGDHVGDRIEDVLANRAIFIKEMPGEPIWLKQTHQTIVSTPQSRDLSHGMPIEADASVTNTPQEVLVIMTADCLPVLFTNSNGTAVGAAHAGWRGLCSGILENTIAELLKIAGGSTAADLMAWLGPAIGPESFEVGEDVVKSFQESGYAVPIKAFREIPNQSGKYLADIYLLAKARLEACGVKMIFGGEYCTVRDRQQFFSYRRDGETGRFASAIWIEK